MPRPVRRVAFALAGVLLALGPVATAAPRPATAAPARLGSAGACQSSTGITVVVDFTAFGGGVQVRCAAQPVSSGFDALTRAGFTFQGTTRFPGLLCRIDGEPAGDPCQGAPPPNAYWAYWHAPRGGQWTYSTSGAGSRKPPAGTVEGWAFGDDAEPGVAPPSPPPSPPTTRPTTTTTRAATGTGGAGPPATPADGTPPATTGEGTSPTTSAADPGSPTSTLDDDAGRAGGTDDPSPDRDGDTGELASAPGAGTDGSSSGGSPVGALAGIAVAAGIGGAAVVRSIRRSHGAGGGP